MDGKLILGFLNYFTIGIVFLFGLLSLLLMDQKKKLTFLFLMFLAAGLLSFLFFAGMSFILSAISIIGFYILLLLLVQDQEFFSTGKIKENSDVLLKWYQIALNIAVSAIGIAAGSFIFYIFNSEYFKSMSIVQSFSTASLNDIIKDMGENYAPLIFLFCTALFMSVVWFISIIKRGSNKN